MPTAVALEIDILDCSLGHQKDCSKVVCLPFKPGFPLEPFAACINTAQIREKAEAFLQLLSAELRRIYDLHEEGKSQDEIADVMGVSQDTIHRRLKKIKEDFRMFYEG